MESVSCDREGRPEGRPLANGWWPSLAAGATRLVILWRGYAIKLPHFLQGWRSGLWGLLGNMQEAEFSTLDDRRYCPVVTSFPGGLVLLQRRARPLSDAEWAAFDVEEFQDDGDHPVPVETGKRSSFGMLGGRIVAIDYGS